MIWERINAAQTPTRWVIASWERSAPCVAGFLLESTGACECLLIAFARQDALRSDPLGERTIRLIARAFCPAMGDRVFGGRISRWKLTEYTSLGRARPFTMPESASLWLPSVGSAAAYVLVHRATTNRPYTIHQFLPHYTDPDADHAA